MAGRYAKTVGDTKRPIQVKLSEEDWQHFLWIVDAIEQNPCLIHRMPISYVVRYALFRAARYHGYDPNRSTKYGSGRSATGR